jgi:hypothetical protein
MELRCPRQERARQDGCLDIAEDGRCLRKEWSGFSYFKDSTPGAQTKVEVYCDRIKATLREQ